MTKPPFKEYNMLIFTHVNRTYILLVNFLHLQCKRTRTQDTASLPSLFVSLKTQVGGIDAALSALH